MPNRKRRSYRNLLPLWAWILLFIIAGWVIVGVVNTLLAVALKIFIAVIVAYVFIQVVRKQ